MKNFEDSASPDPKDWVSVRQASSQLGVSPATLRMWADQGRIPSYRTPGGHRRFKVSEETPFATQQSTVRGGRESSWRLLEHSALGRIRISFDELDPPPWLAHVGQEGRAALRRHERELVSLAVTAVQAERAARGDPTRLGLALGSLFRASGASPRDAAALLNRYRTAFAQALLEFAFAVGEPTFERLEEWSTRASRVFDLTLESMLDCY